MVLMYVGILSTIVLLIVYVIYILTTNILETNCVRFWNCGKNQSN